MSLLPPSDAVRSALATDAWDAAFALIERYDAEVRAAFESQASRPSLAEAAQLFNAHQALVTELSAARDHVAAQLRQFQRDKRGVQAYLGSGA
ncbi:hypothetical protein ACFFGH_04330 [Lysobacter korlensis]|uniref:Uncharacterized protein n=1 Tax=Lysobacter korlensis TaxID=553636 RepID=A0ABV6RKZ9_9GAMM